MLGALVDAGVPFELLERTAAALNIGATLRITHVDRSGIHSTKMDVLEDGAIADAPKPSHEPPHGHAHTHEHTHGSVTHTHSHTHEHDHEQAHDPSHNHAHDAHTHAHPHEHSPENTGAHPHAPHVHGRSWAQIRELIASAALPEDARALALSTFELLAHAEARIHNMPVDQVHFHEVGAVDTIVDIVAAAVGLCSLGVEQWICSSINVGGGSVECAHGRFPVPAPATAELLKGMPTYASGIQMELVTPTGAALLRALGCSFDAPAMRAHTIGYGAGSRDPKRFPNVLRLSIGDAQGTATFPIETVAVLECSIDDLSPQVLARTLELALERGALDAMTTSVGMKKSRLGTLITVLCRPAQVAEFEELLFRETSTLGIRVREEKRVYLERQHIEVETEFGPVRIKLGVHAGEEWNAMPEFEDCRRAAEAHHVPLKHVMQAAIAAYSDTRIPR